MGSKLLIEHEQKQLQSESINRTWKKQLHTLKLLIEHEKIELHSMKLLT
jgi:hypothetical protein